jgi:hypothetical protein
VDTLLLQVILWFGMLFLLWVMKDSLGKVETTIENNAGLHPPNFEPVPVISFSRADKVMDPIGIFQGQEIFRYARIDGRHYEFDHICVNAHASLLKHQRCLAPGLVYSEC